MWIPEEIQREKPLAKMGGDFTVPGLRKYVDLPKDFTQIMKFKFQFY